MEIYVDIVVVENSIINFFLLLLTAKLLRYEYRKIGLYVASVLGGIYTLVVFSQIAILSSFVAKILVAIVLLMISIDIRNIKMMLNALIILFIIAFLLGGICFLLALGKNCYVLNGVFVIEGYSIRWLLLTVGVVYLIINRVSRYLKDRYVVKNLIYDIYIRYGEETLLLRGFLDTGNELREPITNLPCIILENTFYDRFNIPESEKYYIGYKTIGEKGKLDGFKGNEVKIKSNNDNSWISVEAIVCRCTKKLSSDNDFNVLLSRGII